MLLRDGGVEASDARQERSGRHVDVDTDGVDAVLDRRIERARERGLIDVVLVLADADGFRVDLDEFRQRVLQAARNRYRATQGDVEIWEFLCSEFGGGINRGARLGHHHLCEFEVRHFLHEIAGELVGLAACRSVADGDDIDLVLEA